MARVGTSESSRGAGSSSSPSSTPSSTPVTVHVPCRTKGSVPLVSECAHTVSTEKSKAEYRTLRELRVSAVTWNVGGAGGVAEGTAELLKHVDMNSDLIVVGLQEVPLGRRGWKKALLNGLSAGWKYGGGQQYGGMRIMVFVCTKRVQDIAVQGAMRVGVGVADRWPNKGAVAIEVSYGKSCRMCFVVAHLAANQDQIKERQADWVTILRRLDNGEPITSRTTDSVAPIPLFHRYDHVFFMGDLNYRLTPQAESKAEAHEWVLQKIQSQDWSALTAVDQLANERGKGNVFVNFEEAPLTFAPTFKFERKSNNYSRNRIPSYCDRVLWHSLPARRRLVRCLEYRSLERFDATDHRPVYARFVVKAPFIKWPLRTHVSLKGIRVTLEFQLIRVHTRLPDHSLRGSSSHSSPRPLREDNSHWLGASGLLEGNIVEGRPPILPDSDSGEDVFPGGTRICLDDVLGTDDVFEADDPDDEQDCGLWGIENGTGLYGDCDFPGSPPTGLHLVDEDDEDEVEEDAASDEDSEDSSEGALVGDARPIPIATQTPPASCNSAERNMAWAGHTVRSGTGSGSSGAPYGSTSLGTWTTGHTSRSGAGSGSGSAPYGRSSHFISQDSNDESSNTVGGMTADVDVGPRKRHSLSKQVSDPPSSGSKDKRPFVRGLRMEVHGQGSFLKRSRVYRVSIPKFEGGIRERIGDSLPAIPLRPVNSLDDLWYEHVLLVFGRSGSRVGHSGVLPLSDLMHDINKPYAFELDLTKYGAPGRRIEACVQMVVSDSEYWLDSKNRVVRHKDGSSALKNYRDRSKVRKTKAKTVPAPVTRA